MVLTVLQLCERQGRLPRKTKLGDEIWKQKIGLQNSELLCYVLNLTHCVSKNAPTVRETVYSRFPDGYFPGWFFPGKTFPGKSFPGWSFSRMRQFLMINL